jgi:hypothetical protein
VDLCSLAATFRELIDEQPLLRRGHIAPSGDLVAGAQTTHALASDAQHTDVDARRSGRQLPGWVLHRWEMPVDSACSGRTAPLRAALNYAGDTPIVQTADAGTAGENKNLRDDDSFDVRSAAW